MVALASLLAACGATHSAPADRSVVYVAGPPNQIRALDVRTQSVAGTIAVDGAPLALALNTGRGELYCLSAASDGGPAGAIAIISVPANRVQATLALHFRPKALLLSRDGRWLFITGATPRHGVLVRVDVASPSLRRRLELGRQAAALAESPSGQILLADALDHALYLVDGTSMSLRGRVQLAAAPTQVVILAYGDKAFALCPEINQVAALHLQPLSVIAYLQVGADPRQMALKPDGGELYVSSFGGGTVSAIDTTANQVASTILAGLQPLGMAVSADNLWLFVANSGSNTVDMISIYDRRVVAAIPVGLQPARLQLDPLGALLYVEDQGSSDIGVVRTQLHSLLGLLPAVPNPTAMVAGALPETH